MGILARQSACCACCVADGDGGVCGGGPTGLLTAPRFFSMTRTATQRRLLNPNSEPSADLDARESGDTESGNDAMKEVGKPPKVIDLS